MLKFLCCTITVLCNSHIPPFRPSESNETCRVRKMCPASREPATYANEGCVPEAKKPSVHLSTSDESVRGGRKCSGMWINVQFCLNWIFHVGWMCCKCEIFCNFLSSVTFSLQISAKKTDNQGKANVSECVVNVLKCMLLCCGLWVP